MKSIYLIAFVFCFISMSAKAANNGFYCGGPGSIAISEPGGGGQVLGTTDVPVSPTMQSNTSVVIFDASTKLACSGDFYSTDTLYIQEVTTDMPPGYNYKLSFALNGVSYGVPYMGKDIFIIQYSTDNLSVSDHYLPIVFTLTTGDQASDPLVIHKGELLYQLILHRKNSVYGDFYYWWRLVASNDTFIVTTTCEINNGQQINVDFGTVQSGAIGTTLSTTTVSVQKDIPVHCTNSSSVNAHMDIYASDIASGYAEDNVVATSDSNLGVVISKDGEIIPLNKRSVAYFPITNGDGHIVLDVSLLRKSTTVPLAGGKFTASATLILASD